MVFLDTNAFYYVSGLYKDIDPKVDISKLSHYVENKDLALSIVSFYEFIVKMQYDHMAIKRGLDYLVDHKYKIFSNKYYNGNKESNYFIYNQYFSYNNAVIDNGIIIGIINNIVDDKSYIEGNIAWCIYILIFYSALYLYAEDKQALGIDLNYNIIESCCKIFSFTPDIFVQAFISEYKTNDCNSHIKNWVNNTLEKSLSFSIPLVDGAAECKNNEEIKALIQNFQFSVQSNLFSEKIHKKENATSMTYISKIKHQYETCYSKEHYREHLDRISTIYSNFILEDTLKDYIYNIVDKCLSNGSAFYKNDILDAIIICGIKSDDVLISFDRGVYAYMNQNNHINSFDNSINTIDSLYKCI